MTCSQTPPCKRASAPVGLRKKVGCDRVNWPHADIFSPKLVKISVVHAKFSVEHRLVIDVAPYI